MRDAATGKAARGSIPEYVIRLRQGYGGTSRAHDEQGAANAESQSKKMEAWTGIEPV